MRHCPVQVASWQLCTLGPRKAAAPPPSARPDDILWTGPGGPPSSKDGLGARDKGQNLAPPPPIQATPRPGTMFWALRSSWFAICRGTPAPTPMAHVVFDVPGQGRRGVDLPVPVFQRPDGTLLHLLAAKALIQRAEDELPALDGQEKYKREAEIVRLATACAGAPQASADPGLAARCERCERTEMPRDSCSRHDTWPASSGAGRVSHWGEDPSQAACAWTASGSRQLRR